MQDNQPFDAVVIGAGPGGLTAALYLARFRRRLLVLDAGHSRAAWIPATHNHPGFPKGIVGKALLARMRRHAARYGATIRKTWVDGLKPVEGGFEITAGRRSFSARTVLLATGVIDNEPLLPNLEQAGAKGLIRLCPICDGYEAMGRSIGIIGHSEHGVREALFLRTWSNAVTLIHVGEPQALTTAVRAELALGGVKLVETPIQQVHIEKDRIVAFSLGGEVCRFDTVYSALGTTPRYLLAQQAGAKVDEQGRLIVSEHQHTSVDGLYAAGDVVRGLNQMTVAEAEAAIAATDIHNRLRAQGL